MINASVLSWLFAIFAAITVSAGSQEFRQNPVAESKAVFGTVMQHLEPDGDFLFVANAENAVKGIAGSLAEVARMPFDDLPDADAAKLRRFLEKLPGFLESQGMLGLQAVGCSAMPEGDGIFRSRMFVMRSAAAARQPLWRAWVGGEPRRLVSSNYWSEDVVWVASSTGEATEFWKLINNFVDDLIPDSRPDFNAGLADLKANINLDLDAVLKSLGDECFLALTLDRQRKVPLPQIGHSFSAPSLLLGIKLSEPLLPQWLDGFLAGVGQGVPLVKEILDDGTVITSTPPIPAGELDFAIQPSVAYHAADKMLLLGLSSEVVSTAIATARSGTKRLIDSAAFKDELGMPLPANNGICYSSRRLSQELKAAFAAFRKTLPAGSQELLVLNSFADKLGGNHHQVAVFVNLPEGVKGFSHGTSNPASFMQAGMILPVGTLAAIAIPNFVKSRDMAQRNACINNLRRIDSAKEQWAIVNNAGDGAVATAGDLAEFFWEKKIPRCPKGNHEYRINPIGTDPECTSGDRHHVLP